MLYLLTVVSLLTFFPSLYNDVINWKDDDVFLSMTSSQGNGVGLFSNKECPPIPYILLRIQYAIGENGYFIYHAFSVILHAVNVLLLFLLVNRLTSSFRLSAIVAILFAFHPIHAGTVSWISQQPILLSLTFSLLTCFFYLRYHEKNTKFYYWLAVVCSFFFYLSAKPALYLLVMLFGIDWYVNGKLKFDKEKLPFVILWIMGILAELWIQTDGTSVYLLLSDSVTMVRFGIIEGIKNFILPNTVPIFIPSVLPTTMLFGYGSFLLPFLFAICFVVCFLTREKYPILLYGFIFFTVFSLPLLTGKSLLNGIITDSEFYISSIGLCIVIGVLFDTLLAAFQAKRIIRTTVFVISAVLICITLYQSYAKTSVWKNSEIFWQKIIDANVDNVFAFNKIGMAYYSQYKIDPALKNLNKAVAFAPNDAESHFHRGYVHLGIMNIDSAISDFMTVLHIDSINAMTYFNLGIAYDVLQRYDSSIIFLSRAIKLQPNFPNGLNNRANTYFKTGNYVLAFSDYQQALLQSPTFANVYGNLGLMYIQIGNAQQACTNFIHQSELTPNAINVKIHIGFTALLLNDTTLAYSNFSKAFKIDSVKAETYLTHVAMLFLKTNEEKESGEKAFDRFGIRKSLQ